MPMVKKARLRFNLEVSGDLSINKVEMGYKIGEGEEIVTQIGSSGDIPEVILVFPTEEIKNQDITYWSKVYSPDGFSVSTRFNQTMPDFIAPIALEPTGIDILDVFEEEVPDGPPVEPPVEGGEPTLRGRRGR